jgi:hypothetical protein
VGDGVAAENLDFIALDETVNRPALTAGSDVFHGYLS